MITHGTSIKIFSGNSNKKLAEDVAKIIGIPLGESNVTKFSDGEIDVSIYETVRGCDVFVVQSTCYPGNDNLMEMLIMIDAFKRASAGRITAVIPYYGYARQDRKVVARDPITAKLVADLITAAGADRVLTIDLHASQIQGFFDIPVDHLRGFPILCKYYLKKKLEADDLVVMAPDLGSVSRTRAFANRLNAPLAIVDKRRPRKNVAEIMNIIGDVKDKTVLLIDDMIDTAGTITASANAIEKMGAKRVLACCTHPVLSGKAIENIQNSCIQELVVTDTVPLTKEKQIDKIKVLSVAPLLAEAIDRIYEDLPVSSLFE